MSLTADSSLDPASAARSLRSSALVREVARWAIAIGGPLVVFGVLAAIKGAPPIDVYRNMLKSIFTQASFAQILVKATPILLAGLAVAVPARAGLVNVGGEGQLVIGAVSAFGMSLMLGDNLPGPLVVTLMVVAAAAGGALWAAVA